MPSIDWRLRDAMPHLRDSGRLNVLMALILRANVRNRCWPSMELLCKDTGYAMEAVNEAKKWLIKQGAIEMVDYKHRVGKERELPSRQGVYQLTGTLVIAGVVYPYLYISPTEISESEVSPIEISTSESEVVKSFKSKESSKTKKKEKETTIPAVAVSEVSSVPFNGKKQISAQAENGRKRLSKPTTTPTTPPSPTPSPKDVDTVQTHAAAMDTGGRVPGEKVNPAVALGEAWGIEPARGDFGLYGKQAKRLIDNGIPVEEFKAFCDWRKKEAGDWASKIIIGSLTGNGHMSKYLAYRGEAAEKARKQKELEEKIFAQYPEARPRDPSEPVEYATPEELQAIMSQVLRKPTRYEDVS